MINTLWIFKSNFVSWVETEMLTLHSVQIKINDIAKFPGIPGNWEIETFF